MRHGPDLEARFCSNCGMQFAPASGPAPSGGLPTAASDAAAPSPPAGTSMNQPGYPNYPAASAPKRKRNKILLIILAVVIVAGGIGAFIYFRSNSAACKDPSASCFDRHGLPTNIPLPKGANFVEQGNETTPGFNIMYTAWYWTVDSPNDPATVVNFYKTNLPNNGWANVAPTPTGAQGCQNGQFLGVLIGPSVYHTSSDGNLQVINAPSGGSALGIRVTSDQLTVQMNCQPGAP